MYLRTHVEAEVDVSAAEVWGVLNDFGNYYQLHPLIKLSPITNGIHNGLGAEREVIFFDGTSIRQTILDIVEGESLLIGFSESDLPIKHATAKIAIEPPDQSFCRISIDITYEPKYGLVGYIYIPTLRNRASLMLRGLKHFVTTGEELKIDFS